MRYILKPGVKLTKYRCPLCGQEELLSEDEQSKCSNCGEDMSALSVTEVFRAEKHPDPKTAPGAVAEITPEEKPKKRIGRPPKLMVAGPTCSTCSKALVAEKGLFTCKIDCESKTPEDYCSRYSEGTPYGSER